MEMKPQPTPVILNLFQDPHRQIDSFPQEILKQVQHDETGVEL